MSECWQLTAALRWNGAVLEQAWQCLEDGRIEWKPVPPVNVPLPVKEMNG